MNAPQRQLLHPFSKRGPSNRRRGLLAALDDIQSYAEDFLVELQNILLGDLFGYSVSHRAPIDPNSRVVSLANFDELEGWFNNSTPWGRHCAKVVKETRQRLSQDGTAGGPHC
jgi:hypothetical protein